MSSAFLPLPCPERQDPFLLTILFSGKTAMPFDCPCTYGEKAFFPVLCPAQRFSPGSPSSGLLLRKQARDIRIYSASSRSAAQRNVPEAVLKMPRSQPAGGLFGARKSRRNNIPPASFHPGSEIPLCHCGLFSLCRGSLHLTCLHLSLRSLWSCSCRRSVNGKRQVNTHNIQHNALGIRNQK